MLLFILLIHGFLCYNQPLLPQTVIHIFRKENIQTCCSRYCHNHTEDTPQIPENKNTKQHSETGESHGIANHTGINNIILKVAEYLIEYDKPYTL